MIYTSFRLPLISFENIVDISNNKEIFDKNEKNEILEKMEKLLKQQQILDNNDVKINLSFNSPEM